MDVNVLPSIKKGSFLSFSVHVVKPSLSYSKLYKLIEILHVGRLQ